MGNRNRNLIMESQSMRFAREFRPRPRSERIWRPKETPDEDIGNMNLNFEFRQQSEYDDPNEEHQHQFLSDCFDFVFTKDMLKAANIIGQFDKKFLCCTFRLTNKKGVILAAVDQHAADERVQLEKLRRNYRLDTNNFASQRLPTPLSIELLELDVLVLTDNQNQLNHFGVEVRKISATTVLVTRVPSALFGEEGNTSSMSASPLRTLLSDLVNIFKDGCVGWPVPAVLRESVATEACHRAIKFGDLLSEASSQQLLSRLSDCQLPFQCAHGRPTIIPLKLIL